MNLFKIYIYFNYEIVIILSQLLEIICKIFYTLNSLVKNIAMPRI